MARPELKRLPKKSDPNYFSLLTDNVVEAYRYLVSIGMALDYCGVTGQDRARVANDTEFLRRIRTIKAEKYLEEIEELDNLTKEIDQLKNDVEYEEPDFREGALPPDPKEKNKNAKDIFNMKLKAADIRRELLSMSAEDTETDLDTLNIYFIPISREEWEEMTITEIFDGKEHGDLESAVEEIAGLAINGMPKKLLEQINEQKTEELQGGYKVNKDGSVSDW